MKSIIICLLSCLSFTLMAQSNQNSNKWSYDIFFNPNFGYRFLSKNSIEEELQSLRNTKEQFNFGYSMGISLEYRIRSKVTIIGGLGYSNRAYKTKKKDLVWLEPHLNYPQQSFNSFHYQYLDIPLGVKYDFMKKRRFSLYLYGGAMTSMYLQYVQKNHVKKMDGWKVEKDKLNFIGNDVFQWSLFTQVGFEYIANEKFRARIAPHFQMDIKGVNSNLRTREYLYNLGLSVSLVYARQ
ncbi:MAG: PorT family protein [Chitinophagales bacterium]|nr:PorT family protein [Chitinophagales bacterium]